MSRLPGIPGQGRTIGRHFDEYRFQQQVEQALSSVRKVLDTARNPTCAADTPHQYEDKYSLAEFLCNLGLAAELNCLDGMGADEAKLRQMQAWAADCQSVALRLQCTETCRFDRTVTRDVESARSLTEKNKAGIASHKKETVVTKITEHFWVFEVQWELVAFAGTDHSAESRIVVAGRTGRCSLKTSGDPARSPKDETHVHAPIECNVTWLLQNLTGELQLAFNIDRSKESCRTPRRNEQSQKALDFFQEFSSWCSAVNRYFGSRVLPVAQQQASDDAALDVAAINADEIFVPVVPLFEGAQEQPEPRRLEGDGLPTAEPAVATVFGTASVLLPVGDINQFLAEQKRSISEKALALSATFPPADAHCLLSVAEANLLVMVAHGVAISCHVGDGMSYIEDMLTKQMVAAIGKSIGRDDFDEYMRYHTRKIFKPEYAPQPFCYAIRRPDHYPDGVLSIESEGDGGGSKDPAYTMVADVQDATPMSFAINAATRVSFSGERKLHALMAQQFGSLAPAPLSLVARARQFSSFMLLVGKIDGPNSFEPTSAIILQNKDELVIPLLLEQLPTPKAFRDAIESLSPEQQRFAKAFREMQLASSVFGVCVIQLKPQLEKLLKLPEDSLTKEIRLTQDLLSLFIDYQIPSDLLTYEGSGPDEWEDVDGGGGGGASSGASSARVGAVALEAVKSHVAAVKAMIKVSEDEELAEQARAAELQKQRALEEESRRMAELMAAEMDSCEMESCDGAAFAMESNSVVSSYSAAPRAMQRRGGMKSGGGGQRSGGASMQKSAARNGAPPPNAWGESSLSHEGERGKGLGKGGAVRSAKRQSAQQPQPQQQQQQPSPLHQAPEGAAEEAASVALDFTAIPAQLDASFDALDVDAALRPTTVSAGPRWQKTSQPSLLGKRSATAQLGSEQQSSEQNKAFDLLDALSRSGALPIECASLHVIVAATHRFDQTLMETVIQGNHNPIEKLERSSLIVASTIHGKGSAELLKPAEVARVESTSPMLFG